MRKFDLPVYYKSSLITRLKEKRKLEDPRKKDFTPSLLDLGDVRFYVARHFGFCFGVENAIEIAYRTIEENPGKKIYLLSEMIHNPGVNEDLRSRGIEFLMDISGNALIDWDALSGEDIVIIPAFGTTIEIEKKLTEKGIDPYRYNTTCPFVEKVWNRAVQLGDENYTVVIHGKHYHEETKATFSHSVQKSPSVIVRDLQEAQKLAAVIKGELSHEYFYSLFKDRHSPDFDAQKHLVKIGVVNQTTMLATETEAIASLLKKVMLDKYGAERIDEHFADTHDTLCYATNENQDATYGLLKSDADIAIVVGGYNSSNTTHIVELCESKFKTFFISSAEKIISGEKISHFDIHSHKEILTERYLPERKPASIAVTSGASCPDAIVEQVLRKLISFYNIDKEIESVL